VAPASANVIGKIAGGIADDMLTTTFMACKCPKLISPAMNTQMYENPIVQDNIEKCRRFGMEIIEPDSGRLACGDVGSGKLPSEETLVSAILRVIRYEKDMQGMKVLVTAGATQEAIDPVRFISNHSTGKMGFALAKCAMERGADVTVVAAHTSAQEPLFVELVRVSSAQEMFEACKNLAPQADIIIKAAAVADYTPATTADEKIKKSDGDMSIPLKRTEDIIAYLGSHKKPGQFLCGFSMETEHMLENSRKKLEKKNLDMIVANNLKTQGAGFGTDTNVVTILTADGARELPMMSKDEVAYEILSEILKIK
jgi:phosphopantothenoylcysteine decarboxylase/phosphopantothenate--cysteine ligase